MKKIVRESDFIDEMMNVRPDNFSYDGLKALFEYIEQLEDDISEEIEFDPIGLCCDFTEYYILDWLLEQFCDIDEMEEFLEDYDDIEDFGIDDIELKHINYEAIRDYLEYRTTFIEIDDENFIIQQY